MKRTTAPNSVGGAHVDRIAGVQAGTRGIAEDRNNLQEEICHLIEGAGFTLDGTDQYQMLRAQIALSKLVGELIMSEISLTPVTVAGSKSSTNPSNPLYLPIIDRTDADHDVTDSQAPDIVTKYRANAANVLGSTSFTATISGSVLTFANTTANNALLAAISQDAFVQRWFSSGQSATYAASNENFTNGRCINVAGTDYAMTAISVASRTITVSGSPATGSQTVIFYPYRIAGSSTSVRLHRLAGFVPIASGDADGVEIDGLRHMDLGQGHFHQETTLASGGALLTVTPNNAGSGSTATTNYTLGPSTDGSNGTPRVGKNFSPRSHARHVYTWAGRLLA